MYNTCATQYVRGIGDEIWVRVQPAADILYGKKVRTIFLFCSEAPHLRRSV